MKTCLLLLVALALLAGCFGGKDEAVEEKREASDRPTVYVTNYPLKYFVERIASPVIEVRFPVPTADDPAYWNPKAEDVLALQQADLIVLNGASYESWLKNVSLPPSRLVDTSAGFKDRLVVLKDVATHSHGLEGEHEHAGTAFTTWLDPAMAVAQSLAVKDALVAHWPQDRDRFERQFTGLKQDLEALDDGIKKVVAGNPKRPVVFSHPVYQYFEARYGINGRSLHWEPDEMPTEMMWKEFAGLIRDHPATWMIWEGKPSPEIAARLESMGVRSAVFTPCVGMPEQGDFLSVMEHNLNALQDVYGKEVR